MELIQGIIKTNVLTNVYEDWAKNVTFRLNKEHVPPPGGHVFEATGTIFELFHDDETIQTINHVASSVLTRQMSLEPPHNKKNAPPPGGHFHEDWTINVASKLKNAPPTGGLVFQSTRTIFKLVQDIMDKNLLTKIHEDRTLNVASRVLTRQTSLKLPDNT
ncbi:hypothetical protein DPMN_107967 [Dreissena polymorpha]|uniref:Uncharacterized protein n=1 Tax=Dreissena polymorpha TaxID=45954 RepID=A0A9D4K7N3_DREPO|nr:hypothetical protein DPMN_107967 [Dreissena polymorpha]